METTLQQMDQVPNLEKLKQEKAATQQRLNELRVAIWAAEKLPNVLMNAAKGDLYLFHRRVIKDGTDETVVAYSIGNQYWSTTIALDLLITGDLLRRLIEDPDVELIDAQIATGFQPAAPVWI